MEENKNIKLIAFPQISHNKKKVIMLNEQEWQSSFPNHKKLLLCEKFNSLRHYGFVTMVYVLIYLCAFHFNLFFLLCFDHF